MRGREGGRRRDETETRGTKRGEEDEESYEQRTGKGKGKKKRDA